MSIEAMKQAYQILITEPHSPTACDKLEAILRQAIAEAEKQEPVGYAGVKIWVGNHQIKQFLTKVEMESAYEPWMLIECEAQKCIELLKEKNT